MQLAPRGNVTNYNIRCLILIRLVIMFENLVRVGRNIVQLIESTSITKLWLGSKNQITKQCSSEVIEDLPDVLKSLHKREQPAKNQPEPIQQWWFTRCEVGSSMKRGGDGTSNWLVKLGGIKFKHSSVRSIEVPLRRGNAIESSSTFVL